MGKVRLGLIGLGQMGRIHLRNSLDLRSIDMIAAADVSAKSLLLAKKSGVRRVFKDYSKLLKIPDIDAVVISLPNFLHLEAAIRAAEHQKHILIEKPLARNAAEGAEIVSTCKKNSVKLMVGYPLRFSRAFVELGENFRAGTIGEVQIASGDFISVGPFSPRGGGSVPTPIPSWWFDKRLTGGGALIDLGCHLINLFKFYFEEVAEIRSHLGYKFNMEFEDHAICFMKFKRGVKAVLNVGWFGRYHSVQARLYGMANYALASSKSSLLGYLRRISGPDRSTGFYKELEYFVNCIQSNIDPLPSGQEGLEDLQLIAEAYRNTLSP